MSEVIFMTEKDVKISQAKPAFFEIPTVQFVVDPDSVIPFAVGSVSDEIARDWEAEALRTGRTVEEIVAERYGELP
jgi:hypothetical protein